MVYSAGIAMNVISMFAAMIIGVYLISLNTGVAVIKDTIPNTLIYWGQAFHSLVALPIINALTPTDKTLWLTQYTASYMPGHVEPFFGCWFLIHLMVWVFWFDFALIVMNAIPLEITDGTFILKETLMYLGRKVHMEHMAERITHSLSMIMIMCLLFIITFPYIIQMLG